MTYQLDVHGPNSASNSQIIFTMFRSDIATDAMGVNVVPLYASDPMQAAFVNGEQQYEFRWIVDVLVQVNPVITNSYQSATSLHMNIVQSV